MVTVAKVQITESDWDMADWPAEEIVVEGLVMALEGCGRDESPVSVLSSDGKPLRILGVRRTGGKSPASWRVQIVVEI